ncbi:binding-protein-dependent transport systems inner membrane component [Kribbella flavida DSM 17836]|uniref:Binding-protein-dependent transport systems inner membrane component n=1 Tax=Kribbella flavida (strain DSM 17836 / JCM 10339 / NBRC 14399) TaxID=479435 RepID=D2PQ47_KRIFD|nr:ABC transporter permease [Kribbella flavida]ADB34749.1 binding-protein-dependent transport systems inner membrane component [Kribbella flavida DSM 17836]
MRSYAAQRAALAVLQLVVLSVLVFVLTSLLPGDAADMRFTETLTPDQVARLREQLGLDQPAVERFIHWLGDVLRGDLGTSLISGGPVLDIVKASVGATVVLTLATLAVVVPLAVALGILMGTRENGRLDRAVTSVTLALSAIPDFVIAVVLIALFSLKLGWLPATWVGGDLLANPVLLVLPVAVLLGRTVCLLSRQVRAGTINALHAEYVVQARRLGVPRWRLLLRHVLPNAAVPGVQELARTGDTLLGGVLVVEAIFAIPGFATALVDGVETRDLPVVQGLTLVLAVAALVINLGADLVCNRLVPRTELLR